nr:antibiotic biosynthesis monooxygenase [uncultured Draconibacterium sp.]
MNAKPYLVTENYFPKEEYFEDVLNMLNETSEMIEEQDGALMSLSLKPEQKNGPITSITLWTSREKFTNFMKRGHAEKIMKSGLSAKVKSWTTDIKANLYTVEQAGHIESHN